MTRDKPRNLAASVRQRLMNKLLTRNPAAARWGWRPMQRDPVVYVRGKISHSDHATTRLSGWHRLVMNTEHQSRAMAAVAFLD